MRTYPVISPFYPLLWGSVALVLGSASGVECGRRVVAALPRLNLTAWSWSPWSIPSSLIRDLGAVEVLVVLVCALVAASCIGIAHHLLLRSPVKLTVDSSGALRFVALLATHSLSVTDIREIRSGVAIRLAGQWVGLEGAPGMTIICQRGAIAVPCAEPLPLAKTLVTLNPAIRVDGE